MLMVFPLLTQSPETRYTFCKHSPKGGSWYGREKVPRLRRAGLRIGLHLLRHHVGRGAATGREVRPAEAAVQVIKPKRSVLDIILIFFGILWILTILGATFTLDEWWHPAMLVAALLTASPGIVLLLIGFRPKKQKVITKGKPTKP